MQQIEKVMELDEINCILSERKQKLVRFDQSIIGELSTSSKLHLIFIPKEDL